MTIRNLLLLLILSFSFAEAGPASELGPETASAPTLPSGVSMSRNYFIQNQGQVDEQVDFYVKGSSGTIYLAGNEVVYDFQRKLPPDPAEKDILPGHKEDVPERFDRLVFRVNLVGSNLEAKAKGEGLLPGKINYFIGSKENWKSSIPTFKEVIRKEVYPGISFRYFFRGGNPVIRVEVSPQADPSLVQFNYSGVEAVEVNEDGALLLKTRFGDFLESPLKAWQQEGGKEIPIEVTREKEGKNDFKIKLGKYRPELPVYIE